MKTLEELQAMTNDEIVDLYRQHYDALAKGDDAVAARLKLEADYANGWHYLGIDERLKRPREPGKQDPVPAVYVRPDGAKK